MPTSITIEDVPDSVRDVLAARASRKGLTLEEYLRGELDALADKPDMESLPARIAERKEILPNNIVDRGHLGLPRPRPSVSLIVDASVMVAALIDTGTKGTWATERLRAHPLAAPHLMAAEATNILRRAQLAGRVTRDVAALA